ncbi:sensor domain-containing diguanylate cyclase [Amycolatopsis suaedae]|uniref:GGDEF domain-containing protein n=1 Tax=Amycolatopsis suaedae TaxID=2510978 RepID=UPI001F10D049|nr:GGDEF domain-containing protein [Amycolatopsis suaedae]
MIFVLLTDVFAVLTSVVSLAATPFTPGDLTRAGMLTAVGLGMAEVTLRLERVRRRLSDTPHVNLSSVWIMAVTVVTSPALGAATAVVLYSHLWWRAWREISGITVYRAAFNTGVMILSAHGAAAALVPFDARAGSLEQVLALGLAVTAYWAVNSLLVAVVIGLSDGARSWVRLLGSWDDNRLLLGTLCFGAVTAVLTQVNPWLLVPLMLPLLVLHRAVAVQELELAATTDSKTRLLNATTWHALAQRELSRARRRGTPVAVLMADLDLFKRVNDNYGHLVGDQVLRVVGDALRQTVRDTDLTGRFGGEEFVVLLPDTTVDTATRIAARVGAAVRALRVEEETTADLRLTVSIGVAGFPGSGDDLEALLRAADNALFAAKADGRDTVRTVRSPGGSAG